MKIEKSTKPSPEGSPDTSYAWESSSMGDRHRLVRTTAMPSVSRASLISIIDDAFEHYLQKVETAEGASSCRSWKRAVRNRSLSSVTRELFANEVDFSSQEMLSPQGLADLLCKLSEIGDVACARFEAEIETSPYGAWQQLGSSMTRPSRMETAFRLVFKDEAGELCHAAIFTPLRFFRQYLLHEYFFQSAPTAEDIARDERWEAAKEFRGALQGLLDLLYRPDLSDEDRRDVLHNLLFCAQGEHELGVLRRFVPVANQVIEGGDVIPPAQLIGNMSRLLGEHFPGVVKNPIETEICRLVQIKKGPGAKLVFRAVVPVGNFFFREFEANPAEDWLRFPAEGHMEECARDELVAGRQDISVFDAAGQKVFWGDLRLSGIGAIEGPFFVLSAWESYHDIPAWAVQKSRVAIDKNRPIVPPGAIAPDKVGIDTDYMRLKALGIISKGTFIANSPLISGMDLEDVR